MGKRTIKMSGDEMRAIVHSHLIDACDNVSDKSLMSLSRVPNTPWQFIVTIEDDDVEDNQEEWKAEQRAKSMKEWKFLGMLVAGIVGAFVVVFMAAPYIMPLLEKLHG